MPTRIKLRRIHNLDDVPAPPTDAELLEWAALLRADEPDVAPVPAPVVVVERPIAAAGATGRLSDAELFADIFERAAAVIGARGD